MADAREIRIEYEDQASLGKAWRNYIKHGALVARVFPAPANGQQVRILLHPMWEGPDTVLTGTVVQASASTTVLQLEPLDDGARAALVELGVADAAPDLQMDIEAPDQPDAPTVDEALVARTRESDTMARIGDDEAPLDQLGDGPGGTVESMPSAQLDDRPADTAGEPAQRSPAPDDEAAPLAGKSWAEIADEGPRSMSDSSWLGQADEGPRSMSDSSWLGQADDGPALTPPDDSWAGIQSSTESQNWEIDETLMSDSAMQVPGAEQLGGQVLRPLRQDTISWDGMPAVPGNEQQAQAWPAQQQQQGWDQQQQGWDQQQQGWDQQQQGWDQQQQGWDQQQQGWDQQPAPGAPAPQVASQVGGEPMDVRQIAALSGPAGVDTESVLPAIIDSGDFGDKNWRDTLLGFFMARVTGVVVIHAFRENRWCYLVDGSPVHYQVDHSHPGEYLSDALLKDGVVSGRQWTEAMKASKLTGLAPGEYLVRRGLLTREQLQEALVRRAAAITRNLIGANFGNWTLHAWPDVRELFPWQGVGVLRLLLAAERGSKSRLTDEEITKETEPHLDRHVALVDERKALLPELDLDPGERVLVTDLLPGGWTMKELMIYGGIREKPLLRFIWVLRAMGFIELKRDEGPLSKRNRAERILYVALRDIKRRGDFEALHCHWTAIEDEIHAGYRQILEEFGRERFKAVLDPRLEDLIDRIRERADEALSRIKTLGGRTEVRKKIVGEAQLIMAADLMVKQADMEVYKSNFRVAKACYERVLELAPKIAETNEHRKHSKAQLANPQIGAAQTLSAAELADVAGAIDAAVMED